MQTDACTNSCPRNLDDDCVGVAKGHRITWILLLKNVCQKLLVVTDQIEFSGNATTKNVV